MKRLVLITAFALLATPGLALADDDEGDDDGHRQMNATELVAAGASGAALLGLAGYLVLRRRSLQR